MNVATLETDYLNAVDGLRNQMMRLTLEYIAMSPETIATHHIVEFAQETLIMMKVGTPKEIIARNDLLINQKKSFMALQMKTLADIISEENERRGKQ